MRGFIVEIQTDNAAFDDEPCTEIARILRKIATDLENDGLLQDNYLRDINGNIVGVCNLNGRLTE